MSELQRCRNFEECKNAFPPSEGPGRRRESCSTKCKNAWNAKQRSAAPVAEHDGPRRIGL